MVESIQIRHIALALAGVCDRVQMTMRSLRTGERIGIGTRFGYTMTHIDVKIYIEPRSCSEYHSELFV